MAFKLVNEDQAFDSMLAIAKHLGKSRVYRKDFERLGIVEVEDEPTQEVENEVQSEPEEKPTETSYNGGDSKGTENVTDESDKNDKGVETESSEVETPTVETKEETDEGTGDTATEEVDATREILEKALEPKDKEFTVTHHEGLTDEKEKAKAKREAKAKAKKEANEKEAEKLKAEPPAYALELREKAGLSTIEDLYKKIRGAKYEDVIKLAEDLGIGWDENPNPKINRMNVGKALRESMFPGEKRPHRPKSPWNGVPTEKVLELAKSNDIEVRESESEKVTRMWMIKELKAKGIQPPK